MDLLNDLGNDLAVAFLIEKKHRQKLDSRGAVDLIDRIRAALNSTPQGEPEKGFAEPLEQLNGAASH